jgi:hypothetical protein
MKSAADKREPFVGLDVFWFLFAAFTGFLAFVTIPYLTGVPLPDEGGFFAIVSEAVEKQVPTTFLVFAIIGAFVTWVSPRLWASKCIATMAAFPVIAIVELPIHPTSHNLLPFEFMFYAVEAIPAVVGGMIVFTTRRVLANRSR